MLYKYFSPLRIPILSNNMIRFSQTVALNDPFESAPLFVLSGQDQAREDVKIALRKIMEDKGVDLNSPENADFFEKKLIESLAYLDRKFAPAAVGKQLAENLAMSQGVLSLSRVNNNLLMWAHYADSHKGFVIAIDDSHPFFYENNRAGNPTKPHDVVYSSMRRTNRAGDRLGCHKSIDWAYEEEVRVFKNFPTIDPGEQPHSLDKVHLFPLPPECVKQVFIGANASDEDREKILEYSASRPIPIEIFETHLSDERFELQFIKVPEAFAA